MLMPILLHLCRYKIQTKMCLKLQEENIPTRKKVHIQYSLVYDLCFILQYFEGHHSTWILITRFFPRNLSLKVTLYLMTDVNLR